MVLHFVVYLWSTEQGERGVILLLCAFFLNSSLERCLLLSCGICEESHKARKLKALCHNYLPKYLVLMMCLSVGFSFIKYLPRGLYQ